jgi:hypothetical protein
VCRCVCVHVCPKYFFACNYLRDRTPNGRGMHSFQIRVLLVTHLFKINQLIILLPTF